MLPSTPLPLPQESFAALSAVSDEASFPWKAADYPIPDPEWQYTLWTSSMPSAIPEPQSAAMWLVGLAVFGFIARRRRSGRGSHSVRQQTDAAPRS